ncbi:MAG: hypothetical protein IJH53_06060 [Oscillospiraceae bacterium]|nr:hypothetical protein [Oscillospiraceae bacterium]
MGLFRPVWLKETDDPNKIDRTVAAVRRISDRNKLFEIATTAYNGRVKEAAVGGITDQTMLAKLALSAPEYGDYVGGPAVRRIRDKALLYGIAMRAGNREVAKFAAEAVDDRDQLAAMAMGAAHEAARRSAVKRITDQAVLAQIAVQSRDRWTADDAARLVRDPEQALKVAMSDRECAVHCAYILSDPAALRKVACEAPTERARCAAISKLDDQQMLRQIACGTSSTEERKEAVKRLRDADALIDVLQRESDPDIRRWAVSGLRNGMEEQPLPEPQRERLFRLIINDKKGGDETVRLVECFEDPATLRGIRMVAVREDVRAAAFRKFIPLVPAEELPELYEEARSRDRIAVRHDNYVWQDVLRLTASLIREKCSPDQLMPFIKEPSYGYSMACDCIRGLYRTDLDDADGIGALRDAAVTAYLGNTPRYKSMLRPEDEKRIFMALAGSLPPEALEKFGFETGEYEREDEDQYGRNTVTVHWVSWHGARWHDP